MLINYLTKKTDYISYITNKNNTNIKVTSLFLIQNIRKLYSFSFLLTLDRGFKFISKV